ncbi:MAG: glutamine-hydrolyzing carbamoyl-phosphate synthase small subunit [Nannocystaceae bacterium]|nr:glutamine-hydrolyzing carbamoyl-phosphate synthase small subunit [bacterium]
MTERDRPEAVLALADGRVFRGVGFGARATAIGEVVFNTSMTGYQEILTDPSYAGQLVCLTTPEIGNVGCNTLDVESEAPGAEALIIRALSPTVSNWRAEQSLPDFLEGRGVPGISEVDTRALTRHLRETGAIMGAVSTEDITPERLVEMAKQAPSMQGKALAHEVSTAVPYTWEHSTLRWSEDPDVPEATLRVVAYDFGIKHNILRCLRDEGIEVQVVPSTTPAADVLEMKPDGIFLSNGPGDPAALPDVVENLEALLQGAGDTPIFGICLGYQLLCLAAGGQTYKLKFGHHGGNHPVRNELDQSVAITAQNHGFAASLESLGAGTELTAVNLFDRTAAGLRLGEREVWGVQYHPEASPGPHDAKPLFAAFAQQVRAHREQAR